MKNAAAISAQLVDMRNVGAHKSLKLTLHVPEEQALKAIEAFGWPTGVNPVPVALARLTEEVAHEPPPSAIPDKAGATRNKLAQRIGILCSDPGFQKFLYREYGASPAGVAQFVRDYCDVKSRSEIIWDTSAGNKWEDLYSRFVIWRGEPEFVEAVQ